MRMRELGTGGPRVAVVGCGEVSLARAAARGLDSSEVTRALAAALELGIDLVDVAHDAHGDSARLVGEVVRAQRARDRAVVCTRVVRARDEASAAPWVGPSGGGPQVRRDLVTVDELHRALPPHHVVACVDAALRASKLDAIAIAQLELVPADRAAKTAWDELGGACADLVREGKVLRWGAVVGDLGDAAAPVAALADGGWLATAQVTFSACARGAASAIDALAARGVAVLARRVLAGGALAGELGPGGKLALRDDRRALADADLERIAIGAAELAALVSHEPAVAGACDAARARLATARARRPPHVECATLAELALRYAIDRPGIACALVGLHRHAHVLEAVAAAAAAPLSPDLMIRLDQLDI
jgi:aryl-alcohol dehydrogenase-like predicted oxidoreductase